MAMMPHMKNLTLASAKHLLNQGHITPAHHQKIVAAATAMPKMPKMPTGSFGQLAKPKKVAAIAPVLGQQAQPQIPGIGSQPQTDPYSILGGPADIP